MLSISTFIPSGGAPPFYYGIRKHKTNVSTHQLSAPTSVSLGEIMNAFNKNIQANPDEEFGFSRITVPYEFSFPNFDGSDELIEEI